MNRVTLLITFVVLLGFTGGSADAQVDDGSLLLSVDVQVADTVGERYRTWRMYAELPAIRIRYTAANRSSRPLRLASELLHAAYRFRVTDSAEIPVTVQWSGDVYLDRATVPSTLPANQIIELGAGRAVAWDVLLSRRDKKLFSEGSYTVRYGLSGLQRAISTPAGSAWNGRTQDGGAWELTVDVMLPRDLQETVRQHTIVAEDAYEREAFEEALDSFLAAEAVTPNEHPGRKGMAAVFMRLGRYGDAIRLYRQMADESPTAGFSLARAYVAAGQNENAEAALRRVGLREADVKREMNGIRESVSRMLQSSREQR